MGESQLWVGQPPRSGMRFNLFAIYALAGVGTDLDHFTLPLPFAVIDGVCIEDVSPIIDHTTFNAVRARMGDDAFDVLRHIRHALVHRYPANSTAAQDGDSERLVRYLGAWLRVIRPMRQSFERMHGNVTPDGRLDVMGFDSPIQLMEVPASHKTFTLRDEDAQELRATAQKFLDAVTGQFWKFRMAMQFHDLGYYQHFHLKNRFLLWASAIEALFTSHNPNHQGSRVAKERIKWFLGEDTSIYPSGELHDLLADPHITVGSVVDDLYQVRNFIAHGDRIPDRFLQDTLRDGFNGRVTVFAVLLEVQSFIIRKSLLKIINEGLLEYFADAAPFEAYYAAQGLTKDHLK